MTCQEASDDVNSMRTDRGPQRASRAPDSDQDRISAAMADLRRTGWYWGALNANEANEKLKEAAEGTFLVRDSSHRDYFLTISVKTVWGPTNLRIEYQDGKFRLDSVILAKPKLQQFDSVVHLVEYYVILCQMIQNAQHLAPQNRSVQLQLTKPLYNKTPTLQHFCRINIHRATKRIHELPLPSKLKKYLLEYKYQV
ncbi:suppressor of cytokine signaling 2-like isoform X1 [Hypanus sabinus]|uniref:suppressor of cytokine signaling 2-like isoform X1 n=1 Tax=Hypanus sabinus TaxID=79690 RepID=UPI0028C48F4D|nr:suppressor of cytokine signaling 2-like isoform X1 [Hypanus sabinus]